MARIDLLPTSVSGRELPIKGGNSYRPNHNFFEPENGNMTVGFIDLPAGQDLWPAHSVEVPISFFYWEGLDGQIYPGRKWRVQEGARVVGIGTVLEVLPEQA
ncbi:hypothetical protein ABAC402_14010 [Asticcacaulis sp. AC402]|nr:hypothetical protein ABAC402_14010 [Asticcacaulis sp. AC402]